jgi:hypothetical protein
MKNALDVHLRIGNAITSWLKITIEQFLFDVGR